MRLIDHDPTVTWEEELRSAVMHPLATAQVAAVTGAASAATRLVSAGATATTAISVAGGGTAMTMIGANASTHTAVKMGAAAITAMLAAGGAAAVTGNLPAGAQRFTADAASHVGLSLPRPSATVGQTTNATVSSAIAVGGAGQVSVVLGGDGLTLTSIDANAGFDASVITETASAIIVEFRSAGETASVLITETEGMISASVTGTSTSGATLEGVGNGDAQVTGDGEVSGTADGAAGLSADIAETSLDGEVGGGIDVGIGG